MIRLVIDNGVESMLVLHWHILYIKKTSLISLFGKIWKYYLQMFWSCVYIHNCKRCLNNKKSICRLKQEDFLDFVLKKNKIKVKKNIYMVCHLTYERNIFWSMIPQYPLVKYFWKFEDLPFFAIMFFVLFMVNISMK